MATKIKGSNLTSSTFIIPGDLQVDGTTTTINSTTLTVDDKNLVLASGAGNAAAADGAGLTIDGASATFTYAATGDKFGLNKTLDITGNLTLTSTDASGSFGPTITLDRNSSSPADFDNLGAIHFKGRNSADETITYSTISGMANDVTDGTEDGRIRFSTIVAGAAVNHTDFTQGFLEFRNQQQIRWNAQNGSYSSHLNGGTPTADRTITLPDATGTVITTGNLSSITSTGTLSSLTTSGAVTAAGGDGGAKIGVWAGSSDYAFFGSAGMAGNEYSVITNGTNTYVGAGTGGTTFIRGPANDSTPQIAVNSTAVAINDGAIIFNENSGDHDFRVESNNNTHMLFVDGGNDRVGIGVTPANVLHIKGSASGEEIFNIDNSAGSGVHGDTNNNIRVTSNNNSHWANLVVGAHMLNVIPQGGASMLAVTTTGVGIGTTSPGMGLHITGSASSNNYGMRVVNTDASGYSTIQMGGTDAGMYRNGSSQTSYGGASSLNLITVSGHPIAFSTSNALRMQVDGSGNVTIAGTSITPGLGNTTTGHALRADGIVSFSGASSYLNINRNGTGTIQQFSSSGNAKGSVTIASNGVTYGTTSDIRLKQDIEPLDATDKLMAMNPVSYKWKADPDGPRSMGFIAQEMQEIMPNAVSTGEDADATMSMDYGRITPIIVSALQKALQEIDILKDRIAELEAK